MNFKLLLIIVAVIWTLGTIFYLEIPKWFSVVPFVLVILYRLVTLKFSRFEEVLEDSVDIENLVESDVSDLSDAPVGLIKELAEEDYQNYLDAIKTENNSPIMNKVHEQTSIVFRPK